MRRYAVRALPWGRLALTCALLVVLLAVLRLDPWRLWPLQGVAVGLLAGAVGWCLDEPVASVADATPRGLAWRTTARLTGVAVLMAAWAAGVWWAREDLFGHADAVLLQGLGAAALGCLWGTWRRAAGEASPGHRWALAVVPLATAWALVRPWDQQLPIFPYATTEEVWATSRGAWTVVTLVSLGCLIAVLARDAQWPGPARTRVARG